jgi:hypothetical protein
MSHKTIARLELGAVIVLLLLIVLLLITQILHARNSTEKVITAIYATNQIEVEIIEQAAQSKN